MIDRKIKARFREFELPEAAVQESASVAIPTVRGNLRMRYGGHVYYFLNFRTRRGLEVKIGHLQIMKIGFRRFLRANHEPRRHIFKLRYLFQRYHYGMSLFEQLFLINSPHTMTHLGDGRFAIGLWAYFGCLIVDCRNRTVVYRILEEEDDDHVLGSHQWRDPDSGELYFMSYSLKDSLRRSLDPHNPVSCRVLKLDERTGQTTRLWQGKHTDYLHDIALDDRRQYCVIPEFGLYLDAQGQLIPSRALVLDLKHDKRWVIPELKAGAHVKFDPRDPDVIYLSNHNFKYVPMSLFKYALKGHYVVSFFGPGTISKHRLTPDGPEELGAFTHPKLFRVFDHEVFFHRGRKLIAVIGFPNAIYLADADDLTLVKIIEVKNPRSSKHLYRDFPCAVGTIAPSLDGEKIYVQTRYSFQIIDIDSGKPDWARSYFFGHSCTNHMIATSDTAW